MQGHPYDGEYQIEIKEGATWVDVVSGLQKNMAESLVRESVNRVILG